jgi:hypothetical protein
VPLSKIQSEILRLLAAHRNPEICVGVFHDREERVSQAAMNDASVLQAAGYTVGWLRQQPLIYTAAVTKDSEGTRLEWVVDSDYRFFPTLRDARSAIWQTSSPSTKRFCRWAQSSGRPWTNLRASRPKA